jgi:deoxyribodipyrimidine photolyase
VRIVSLSLALLIFATCGTAMAGVSTFPSSYHPRGDDYYENLRAAKIAWLKANVAAIASDLAARQAVLAARTGDEKIAAQATIDRLEKQAGQIRAELAVMRRQRDARQEDLLKRNVQNWVGAARRSGKGAQAIRLMHDLEGTGL